MVESLPTLEKEQKVKPSESSDRPMVRKRSKVKIIESLEKKRSQTECEKDLDLLQGHYHYQNGKDAGLKEVKESSRNDSKR